MYENNNLIVNDMVALIQFIGKTCKGAKLEKTKWDGGHLTNTTGTLYCLWYFLNVFDEYEAYYSYHVMHG